MLRTVRFLPLCALLFGCSDVLDTSETNEISNASTDEYIDPSEDVEAPAAPAATASEGLTLTVDADSGPRFLNVAEAFAGTELEYALDVVADAVRIDAFDGTITVETDLLEDSIDLNVTAKNNLGSSSVPVRIAVARTAVAAAAPTLPQVPAYLFNDAKGKPKMEFGERFGAALTNSGFFGPSAMVTAFAAYSGNTAADSAVLSQIRFSLGGDKGPVAAGGYAAQHELGLIAAFVIASRTPRVWSKLSTAERDKVSLLIRAEAYANAYTSSDKNPDTLANRNPQRNLRGEEHWRAGNPNFKCAAPALVQLAGMYFGKSTLKSMLASFNMSAFANSLRNAGLTNAYKSFMRPRAAGSVGSAPTASQVQAAVKTWKFNGLGIDDTEALFLEQLEATYSKPVSPGLAGGAGKWDEVAKANRGRIASGASGLPNRGATGMVHELDSSDAGGPRSAMSYSMWAHRVMLDWWAAAIATRSLNLKSSALRADVNRMNIGVVDLKYKSDRGYLSYSKGGRPAGNNEDWNSSLSSTWGWSYSYGLWTDSIRPYVLAQ